MVFGNKEKKEQQERESREAALRQEQAQQEAIAAAEAEREQAVAKFLGEFQATVNRSVADFGKSMLYRQIYVPVDAQMNQFGPASGLDLEQLNSLGTQGWKIESAIPRTYGGFESYKISKTTAYGVSGWGKDEHQVGLGGHIVGVYLILSYEITPTNLDASRDVITLVAEESLPDELRKVVT